MSQQRALIELLGGEKFAALCAILEQPKEEPTGASAPILSSDGCAGLDHGVSGLAADDPGISTVKGGVGGRAEGRAGLVFSGGRARQDAGVGHRGGEGSVSAESSGGSWADLVEEEQERDSVLASGLSVSGVPRASEAVRGSVVFGGFASASSQPRAAGSEGRGLMAEFVKTSSAKDARRILLSLGIKLPKQSGYDLALLTHTAATVPAFFRSGKDRIRTFAVLGDAALLAVLSARALERGLTVDGLQRLRSTVLTDSNMGLMFARSTLSATVSLGAGVTFSHSKTGATALEAFAGLIAYYRTPGDVAVLAKYFGLVDS